MQDSRTFGASQNWVCESENVKKLNMNAAKFFWNTQKFPKNFISHLDEVSFGSSSHYIGKYL